MMVRIIIEPKSAENIKRLVQSAVQNELRIIKFGITKTKRKLREFEKRFVMDSGDFYRQFNEGKVGDDPDYIRWAGEYETLEHLQRDYNDLLETQLC